MNGFSCSKSVYDWLDRKRIAVYYSVLIIMQLKPIVKREFAEKDVFVKDKTRNSDNKLGFSHQWN